MTTFYFQVEMTKPSDHYWTIGLNLEATDYNEALRIFRAWAFGVEAVSSLTPHLRNFGDKPAPERCYFNMDAAKIILAELTTFMNEPSHDSDDEAMLDPDMVATDPDDDCPF